MSCDAISAFPPIVDKSTRKGAFFVFVCYSCNVQRMRYMKKALLYIHGKGGSADEAEHYKTIFTDYEVIGFDYHGETPWETKKEFSEAYNRLSWAYERISIVSNSIGAYFTMNALAEMYIEKAFFISPIVNMEKLISDMLRQSGISERELEEKKEIKTSFGEVLSWEYLCYVRKNPIVWNVPTDILYGENDILTSIKTISEFAERCGATFTVMKNGEHWFHTEEQMKFMDNWLKTCLKKGKIK